MKMDPGSSRDTQEETRTELMKAPAADEWLDGGGEQMRKSGRMRKDNKRITPENATAQRIRDSSIQDNTRF